MSLSEMCEGLLQLTHRGVHMVTLWLPDFPKKRKRGLKSRDFRALAVVRFKTNGKRSRD